MLSVQMCNSEITLWFCYTRSYAVGFCKLASYSYCASKLLRKCYNIYYFSCICINNEHQILCIPYFFIRVALLHLSIRLTRAKKKHSSLLRELEMVSTSLATQTQAFLFNFKGLKLKILLYKKLARFSCS